jgi:hypothetical protein
MVNVNEVPTEKPRIDLATLPNTMVLKAVREEYRQATEGKTGGLVIWYETEDGKQFPQKYSKIHGSALKNALFKLGFQTTEDLQNWWCEYEKTSFRTGFPRMIPVKKIKEWTERTFTSKGERVKKK